jgi:nucleoside 2-deoxyribosyltransferase
MTKNRLALGTMVAIAALAPLSTPQQVLPLALPPSTAVAAPQPSHEEPLAYVASPLGFSEAGKLFYEAKLLPVVRNAGFKVLDPWTLTPQKLIDKVLALPYGEKRRAEWQKLSQVIARNNAAAIEKCDLVVAVLDGTDVDSGTAAEIGYAAALGKTILGYRNDFRRAGDNEGSIVNLQVEYFVRLKGGQIVNTLVPSAPTPARDMGDLKTALKQLHRGKARR